MVNVKVVKNFAKQIAKMDGMELGSTIIVDSISFIPIIKQEIPVEDRDYLTLSEALEKNICRIIDKGTEVAHILFENLGDLPILIEEGEIFKGAGTQDRISVGTVMVQPGKTREIAVKCVHAPHHLSSGALFKYGGKASREMLKEIRHLKYKNAMMSMPASQIDQSHVWATVDYEMQAEPSVYDKTQYTQGIEERSKRAKKRSKSINFPQNTIGLVVIDPAGNIKGIEIHRSPHNFNIRKEGIFESLEATINWDSKGKVPFPKTQEKVISLFEKLSNLKEGKDALNQVEVDGLVINMEDLSGEAFTNAFYSSKCPQCKKSKPRNKKCPHCGFEEKNVEEELTYMSLY
jgi:ribosomal protein L32